MPVIQIFQETKASPASIFAYLTEQGLLAKWLTPALIAFPKKGTSAAFALGNEVNFKVEIVELIENKEIRWKCIDGNVNWIGSEISFLLTKNENGTTLLEFTHSGLKQTVEKEEWTIKWQYYLSTLNEIAQ